MIANLLTRPLEAEFGAGFDVNLAATAFGVEENFICGHCGATLTQFERPEAKCNECGCMNFGEIVWGRGIDHFLTYGAQF